MKVVVTTENVTKIAETVLLNVYDTLDNTCPTAVLIEAELERRAHLKDLQDDRIKHEKTQTLAYVVKLKSEISSLFTSLKQGQMVAVVDRLGDKYANDYVFDEETFTITSLVAHKSPSFITDTWEHDTKEEALIHLKNLLFSRIYDNYMRKPTSESLAILKDILENSK